MTETHRITENTAQTVVFLETLAKLVDKSPESYCAAAAQDLALDWRNELVAVLFARTTGQG